jgi:hypothetical protein
MRCAAATGSAVRHVFVSFQILLEATLVDPIPADNEVNTPFLTSNRELISISHTGSTWTGLAFVFKRYMLCEIIFTVRWRLHLFDWTSERVLNWHGWFLWLVGVTMPTAHSPAKSAYVQIVKQNLVNKLVGVTPCHLPFLSIFVLVRSVVTL